MIVRAKAPLRLGLAGGGTDVSPFCNNYGGAVLNVTINMYTYCIIEPTNNNKIVFNSLDKNKIFECSSVSNILLDDMLLLHKGVYNRIIKDYNNGKALSFKMTTYSDAPAGSGLGSSSAMVVAIIKAYIEWLNIPLGDYELAYLAYEIEREDLMLTGGRQDQFAATFGGFNFMEFFSNNNVIVNPLRLKDWIKNEIESSMLLYYIGISRDSDIIIKDQINNTTTNNKVSLKAMHDIKDCAIKMKNAILQGELDKISYYLNLGWKYKKKMSSLITNTSIDNIYDYVIKNKAKAAKISGAGGGGFMLIICDPENRYNLIKKLQLKDGFVRNVQITELGAQSWTIY